MTGAASTTARPLSEAEGCRDQDVYVVGGANSAGQAAVYLARFAKSVTMLVRAPSLEKSMSYYLIEQIRGIDGIKVRTCTEVAEVGGEGHLEPLTLRDMNTGETETVNAGQLFIFIGAAPRTGWLDGVVARDDHGFVLAGPDLSEDDLAEWTLDRLPYHLETSVPGVFVAGDVRSRVRQARRVRGGRGRHGRDARAPLPGAAMTTLNCDPGRAPHAVPVRQAHRRAARALVPRGSRGAASGQASSSPRASLGRASTC